MVTNQVTESMPSATYALVWPTACGKTRLSVFTQAISRDQKFSVPQPSKPVSLDQVTEFSWKEYLKIQDKVKNTETHQISDDNVLQA